MGAVISQCGRYRYLLAREWEPNDVGPGYRTMLFVMLNPSTADATHDDPTIRRCIGFAKREGCAALMVVNLFAYRATDPEQLEAARADQVDIVGPDNADHVADALDRCCGPIVAAWGAHRIATLNTPVRRLVLADKRLKCLSLTAARAPRHPLYLRSDRPLEPYNHA